MKFNKTGQLLLVSAAALLLSTTISACLGTLTIDYLFLACSKAAGTNNFGEIDVLEVDSQTGSLKPLTTSPFFSQGRDPVAEAVSHDSQFLYVVNEDDNSIVQFLIGTDGKLYAQSTTNTPGIFPVALAVDPSDSYLYVIDTYYPGQTCNPITPCTGSLAIFPILTASQVSGQTPAGSLRPAMVQRLDRTQLFPLHHRQRHCDAAEHQRACQWQKRLRHCAGYRTATPGICFRVCIHLRHIEHPDYRNGGSDRYSHCINARSHHQQSEQLTGLCGG